MPSTYVITIYVKAFTHQEDVTLFCFVGKQCNLKEQHDTSCRFANAMRSLFVCLAIKAYTHQKDVASFLSVNGKT